MLSFWATGKYPWHKADERGHHKGHYLPSKWLRELMCETICSFIHSPNAHSAPMKCQTLAVVDMSDKVPALLVRSTF